MSQVDEAWKDVGEQFQKLGAMFREHYDAQEGEPEEPPSDEEMEEAVRKLTEGIKSAFGAAGDTFKDPALMDEARVTASSFFNALGATFEEIAATITAKREKASGTTPEASGEWVPDGHPDEETGAAPDDEEG
jgi:hypothetical protein